MSGRQYDTRRSKVVMESVAVRCIFQLLPVFRFRTISNRLLLYTHVLNRMTSKGLNNKAAARPSASIKNSLGLPIHKKVEELMKRIKL